jgi:hypothetical protein
MIWKVPTASVPKQGGVRYWLWFWKVPAPLL